MVRCYWPTSRQKAYDVMKRMIIGEWYDVQFLAKRAKTTVRTMGRFMRSFKEQGEPIEHRTSTQNKTRQSLWRRI